MIGHDIRNPLQSILGELYLSKSDVNCLPDGDAKKNLKESIDNHGRKSVLHKQD